MAGCSHIDQIAAEHPFGSMRIALSLLFACTSVTPAVPDAPIDAGHTARRRLAVIIGQSNAEGMALASDMPDLSMAQPFTAVPYIGQVGTDTNPPTVTSWPLGPLQPHLNQLGQLGFGVELTLGRALDAMEPNGWAIAKFAYGSTALAGEWNPAGAWPTGMPNLFEQQIEFVNNALLTTNSDLGAFIWIQGEADALTLPLGSRYELELAEFIGAERERLHAAPEIPFVYGRLNAAISASYAGAAEVRAAQEANQAEYAIMVDQDPYPLGPDSLHYTAQSYLDLGKAYAAVLH